MYEVNEELAKVQVGTRATASRGPCAHPVTCQPPRGACPTTKMFTSIHAAPTPRAVFAAPRTSHQARRNSLPFAISAGLLSSWLSLVPSPSAQAWGPPRGLVMNSNRQELKDNQVFQVYLDPKTRSEYDSKFLNNIKNQHNEQRDQSAFGVGYLARVRGGTASHRGSKAITCRVTEPSSPPSLTVYSPRRRGSARWRIEMMWHGCSGSWSTGWTARGRTG